MIRIYELNKSKTIIMLELFKYDSNRQFYIYKKPSQLDVFKVLVLQMRHLQFLTFSSNFAETKQQVSSCAILQKNSLFIPYI